MANSSATQPPPTLGVTEDNSADVGPLSILPIIVSLLAVVAIAIAACVFYRKRQRQRAELISRQLRMTERRIDAVWEKRGRDVERKPTFYYPPSDVRASASEPSVVTRPGAGGTRPHYVIRAYQPRLVPLSQSKPRDKMSVVNSSACSCNYGVETCSNCKEDENKTRRDASDGSLAVELATVPSLGTISEDPRSPQQHQREKGRQQVEVVQQQEVVIRRIKSDTAAVGSEATQVRRSLQIESSTLLLDKAGLMATPTQQVLEWMEKYSKPAKPLPPSTSLGAYQRNQDYTPTTATSTNEQEPPPNTPVSRSLVTSVESPPPGKVLSYISEDTQSEKWV